MSQILPQRPCNVGKRRTFKDITGSDVHFEIVDEIVVPQGEGKLIYFQQFRHDKDQRIEYRLTYYMIGHKPARRGQWVFGQYSLMVPGKELTALLEEARKRHWPGI